MRRRTGEQEGVEGDAKSGKVSKKVPPRRQKPKKGGWSSIYLWGGLAASAIAALVLYLGIQRARRGASENVWDHLAPFPGPKVTDLEMFNGQYKEDMLWGTYRPHVYLGVRARQPESLLAGLMWIAPKADAFEVRHNCQQNDRVLKTYGWQRHNGRTYGRQNIVDGPFTFTTFFAKSVGEEGSGYGGDWAVRVSVRATDARPQDPKEQKAMSFLFYLGDEGGKPIQVMPGWDLGEDPVVLSEARAGVLASGTSELHGDWELHFRLNRTGAKILAWEGMRAQHFHNLSSAVELSLARSYQNEQGLHLPRTVDPSSNLAILQVTLYPPAEADFIFVSSPRGEADPESVARRVEALSGSALDARITDEEAAFDERFSKTFPIADDIPDVAASTEVAKGALSNMLGGMGYFYGQSRIAIPKGQPKTAPYWLYWAAPLFTAVPSRSFFPRGFLWDEGFHQLIVGKWDALMSMDCIAHWLDLINANGWIPREQILGEEARSFVPEEFVQQHTDNGNPPTLFLPLFALAGQATTGAESSPGTPNPAGMMLFLERALPRMQRWFLWFNTTQRGSVPGSYFWHGRDTQSTRELNPKTLQSGLDDYPRASHPGPEERHLDLRCWLAVSASLLSSLRRLLGGNKDGMDEAIESTTRMMIDNELLHKLHWDKETNTFSDFGNHTQDVRLARVEFIDQQSGTLQRSMERAVGTPPSPGFVPQFGYVSLFPLLLRILPTDSPSLGHVLHMLGSEDLLWTPYGLRSLAANSSMYLRRNTEHDPPYWRGPIWININYLALAALHYYSEAEGPYQETAGVLYHDLRDGLIRNIVRQFKKSGYLWEQYDPKTGRGKGSHPFTGWTALIVMIMSEQYR